MSDQTGKRRFRIGSLLAAGVVPFVSTAQAENAQVSSEPSLLDRIKNAVSNIEESQQTYTLAQHRSHSSHGSHSSHSSHRSSGVRPYPPGDDLTGGESFSSTRNESSTPRSAILPSPAAAAQRNKLKILPGNSGKFRDAVTRAQVALISEGYDVGDVSGELHARTIAAIYEYQANTGLVPSGQLTPETLAHLGITVL